MKVKALTLLTLAMALTMVASPILAAQEPPIPAAPRTSPALQIDPPEAGAPSGGQPDSRSGALDDTPPVEAAALAGFSEGFDNVAALPGQGWFIKNNSSPVGPQSWYQGNITIFAAQAGAADSYIAVDYNSTTGANTISNWLLTPELNLANGDVLTFWTRTRTGSTYPDRMEVRLSTAGASTNVGAATTDVGDFTTLLAEINPSLTVGGYPAVWTQYTITLSGLGVGAAGRFAFRYFVTNGGPSGANSDYIGIDTLNFTGTPVAPFAFPSATLIKVGWTSPDDGWASDNVRTLANGGNMTVGYNGFNIGVPEYAVIDGIEVNVEGYTTGRNVAVSLSWDGGANWTSTAYTTSGLPGAAPDGNVVLGNATNTWGRAWTAAEVNSATGFVVRLVTDGGPVSIFYLDSVSVMVTYRTLACRGGSVTFADAGILSWTAPAGVTSVTAEAWGGGGRGGSRTLASGNGGGGGGGGGAYSRRDSIAVTPGTSYTVVVGAGATGTAAAGGDSYFISCGDPNVCARGGVSGVKNSGVGAVGGSASTGYGDIRFSGGRGANTPGNLNGGGGGSSAGTSDNGNYTSSTGTSTGATAPTGGGNGGNGFVSPSSTSGNGSPGSAPGGGGGGGKLGSSGAGGEGGSGADGQVVISWDAFPITSSSTGDWSAAGTWSPDGAPDPACFVVIANGTTVTLEADKTTTNSVTVSSGGTLNTGTNTLSGTGAFILSNGGTLGIGSTAGIASSGATGNIRTTIRSFSNGANYVYNGSLAQNTGDGLPTSLGGSLTIDNPSGVTIVAAPWSIANGVLNLVSGTFNTNNGGDRLSMASSVTINRSGGSLSGTLQGSGSYNVNYTGNSKTTGSELSGSGLDDITLNLNADQTLTLDQSRSLAGTLALTNGRLALGSNNLTIGAAGAIAGSFDANTMVVADGNGALCKVYPATGSFLYPIGDVSGPSSTADYSPATLDFTSGAFSAGQACVRVTDAKQPDNTSTTNWWGMRT